MNRRIVISLIISLVSGMYCVVAQVNDAQLWMSINLEKRILSPLTVYFSQEIRMNENMTEAGTIFSDVGIGWKFSKRFRVEGHYRFTLSRRIDDSYSKGHQYYIDFNYREKVKPLVFLLRLRLQSKYTDIYSSPEGKVPDYNTRVKFTIKPVTDRKWQPYLYAESFWWLNDPKGVALSQMRYCAGIEYSINKRNTIDIFYMIRREYNTKIPQTDYVIGVGYYIRF